MSTIKHKIRGTATVIGRDGDRVRIKYDSDGYETVLIIPDSFTYGIFEIGEELQREVDLTLEAKKEAERIKHEEMKAAIAQAAAAKTPGVKANRTPKTPAKVKIKGAIESDFEKYLIASGYSVETPSGLPSTVSEYIRAINSILEDEGLTWNGLISRISELVMIYGKGGAKEDVGSKSNWTYINALHRFEDFVNNATP